MVKHMVKQNGVETRQKKELGLGKIFEAIWDKSVIIILSGIIIAFVLILFTQLFIEPEYEAESKLFVLARQSQTSVNSSDMEASDSLTQDYIEFIRSRSVLEGTISQLELEMTYEDLLSNVIVVAPVNTNIISITVSANEPYLAAELANRISETSMEMIRQVMNVDTVEVLDSAEIPSSSESPSLTRNGIVGGMLGILLSVIAVIWKKLADNTIKDRDDVKYYLNLELLGIIPLSNREKTKRKRKNHEEKIIT